MANFCSHVDEICSLYTGRDGDSKYIWFTSIFDKCCAVLESSEPVKPDASAACIVKEMRYGFRLLIFLILVFSDSSTE